MQEDKNLSIRKGDEIDISGDYQFRALTEGPIIQRYWHYEKQNIINFVCKFTSDDIVLDCGCGSGVIANYLSSQCNLIVGLDGNEKAIQFAKSKFKQPNVKFIHALVEDINYPPEYFTKVLCLEIIEHLYEEQGLLLLKDFHRLLSRGGNLFLTTPNYHGTWPLIEWVTDLTNKVPHLAEDQHVTRYHRKKLISVVQNAGFKIIKVGTFCTFAPFVSCLSWKFANKLSEWERKVNLPYGNISYIYAVKL